ncbi:MAG TPA: hypothetical protein PKO03_10725, partial [Anaerolineaceae bacterium]|nr:hypothetical protein [Anaerolineaceae bacterium]
TLYPIALQGQAGFNIPQMSRIVKRLNLVWISSAVDDSQVFRSVIFIHRFGAGFHILQWMGLFLVRLS